MAVVEGRVKARGMDSDPKFQNANLYGVVYFKRKHVKRPVLSPISACDFEYSTVDRYPGWMCTNVEKCGASLGVVVSPESL